MNIFYYEEYMTNTKVLNFATYGGSVKMHSQAEQEKVVLEAFKTAKLQVEEDINKYTFKTAPHLLFGLGARTSCYYQLMSQRNKNV